jgi:hypothetical protein
MKAFETGGSAGPRISRHMHSAVEMRPTYERYLSVFHKPAILEMARSVGVAKGQQAGGRAEEFKVR